MFLVCHELTRIALNCPKCYANSPYCTSDFCVGVGGRGGAKSIQAGGGCCICPTTGKCQFGTQTHRHVGTWVPGHVQVGMLLWLWFSSGGDFVLKETLAMSGDSFDCHNLGAGGCSWNPVGGSQYKGQPSLPRMTQLQTSVMLRLEKAGPEEQKESPV